MKNSSIPCIPFQPTDEYHLWCTLFTMHLDMSTSLTAEQLFLNVKRELPKSYCFTKSVRLRSKEPQKPDFRDQDQALSQGQTKPFNQHAMNDLESAFSH